jgi:serine/threonine-protein kinase
MEYIDGRTALQWLLHLGKYRDGDALLVGLACARGLEHAHAHGMIHRDVKPDNVLVGKDGAIKLGDLGLARCLADELAITQTGWGTGTPLYMAPEQGRNARHVDHRSDLYALGCTLYQLLTGCLPFPGGTLLEIVLAKMKGRYTPARQLNPEVPPRLDRILARLLAPFPEDRYPSCAGLIADLTALGLAHPQLSFARMSATTQHAIAPPTLPEVQAEPSERWYVIYRNVAGCWVSRQMTTPEVCDAVRGNDDFALTAQASRTAQGEYRSLEVFEAFRAAYRARRKKARVERQVADLAAQVEELTAVERRRSRWGWLWRLFRLG